MILIQPQSDTSSGTFSAQVEGEHEAEHLYGRRLEFGFSLEPESHLGEERIEFCFGGAVAGHPEHQEAQIGVFGDGAYTPPTGSFFCPESAWTAASAT